MNESPYTDVIKEIRKKDPRYEIEAYFFIREALNYSIARLKKPTQGPERHISGQQLLEGIREYALQEFGPATMTVLSSWGLTKTDDFGDLVFHLVESKQLSKTDEDKKEDFAGGYDFYEAFKKPFLPKKTASPGRQKIRNSTSRKSTAVKRGTTPKSTKEGK